MERGADDYLIKPFSARELLARVQTHLELARVRKQSQEVLRQRTAQFETLLDAAPLGVYLVDADFRLQQVNPTARLSFGDIPDMIGRDFDDIIRVVWPAAYADEIVARFRHTLETGEPYIVPSGSRIARTAASVKSTSGRSTVFLCPMAATALSVISAISLAWWKPARRSPNRSIVSGSLRKQRTWYLYWYPSESQATWENDRVYEIYGRTREDGPLTATTS